MGRAAITHCPLGGGARGLTVGTGGQGRLQGGAGREVGVELWLEAAVGASEDVDTAERGGSSCVSSMRKAWGHECGCGFHGHGRECYARGRDCLKDPRGVQAGKPETKRGNAAAAHRTGTFSAAICGHHKPRPPGWRVRAVI